MHRGSFYFQRATTSVHISFSQDTHEMTAEIFTEGCPWNNPPHFYFRATALTILFQNALPLGMYTLFLHLTQVSTI